MITSGVELSLCGHRGNHRAPTPCAYEKATISASSFWSEPCPSDPSAHYRPKCGAASVAPEVRPFHLAPVFGLVP